jgi:nitrite reductase (NADH) small subunit
MTDVVTGTATDRGRYRVCALADIADGEGVLADLGEREVGVFRRGDRLYAYLNRCIHMAGPVCSGELLGATRLELDAGGEAVRQVLDDSEPRLVCPWHGWEYDLLTGEVVHDRSLRLRSFPVTVEDGIVYVDA